jgi:hypothetical protein
VFYILYGLVLKAQMIFEMEDDSLLGLQFPLLSSNDLQKLAWGFNCNIGSPCMLQALVFKNLI